MIGFLHIDEDPESNPLLLNHPETQKNQHKHIDVTWRWIFSKNKNFANGTFISMKSLVGCCDRHYR